MEKNFNNFKKELKKYLLIGKSKKRILQSPSQRLKYMEIEKSKDNIKLTSFTCIVISKLWENYTDGHKINDIEVIDIAKEYCEKEKKLPRIFSSEETSDILCEIIFPRLFQAPKNKEEVELNSRYAQYHNKLLEQQNNTNVRNLIDVMTDVLLYGSGQNGEKLSSEEKLGIACDLCSEISEEQKEKIIEAYRQNIISSSSENRKILQNYILFAKNYIEQIK